MKYGYLSLLTMACIVHADPSNEMVYQLKGSIAKVHVTTKNGGHGVGSGVVVAEDTVATNCHVLADAVDVKITKFGDSIAPIALKTDWKHDLCMLKFQYLELKPVVLANNNSLSYEQEIFSIGFPGGPPKPVTSFGYVKALYPYEDAEIIRTSASFIMGASGSPVFNESGQLVGISTFKSPGKGAYYYNIPVKWVKRLLYAPETESLNAQGQPFWDAPENAMPYFMRVVLPYQSEDWIALQNVASEWLKQEPNSVEAQYYLGVALVNLGQPAQAKKRFNEVLNMQSRHSASLIALGLMAQKDGDASSVQAIREKLRSIHKDLDKTFDEVLLQLNTD